MIIAIIGHRGVGKTSLLQRWKSYQPDFEFFDLDEEIEKRTGESIPYLFSNQGETYFRKLEIDVFKELTQNQSNKRIISCGGGFDLTQIPQFVKKLWVRRDSDSLGRVMPDRPSININIAERELRYSKYANSVYTMPEGLTQPDNEEKKILLRTFQADACLTLFSSLESQVPGAWLEWRDDLLDENQFLNLNAGSSSILYSVRTDRRIPEIVFDQKFKIDWDLQSDIPKNHDVHYLSTHEDQIEDGINRLKLFEHQSYQLKLCPLVKSWKELKLGFDWQQENPKVRSFLPRSIDGRWNWFRLFMKNKQNLNFVRTSKGSSLDQPILWQWLSVPQAFKDFAAVLGSPVSHSYSPAFHKSFFKKYSVPFFNIQIDESDWEQAFPLLQAWGLKFAAVTSPLKKQAGALVHQTALNTLAFDEKAHLWASTNTDLMGLQSLLSGIQSESIVVWGGGGLLPTLKTVLPISATFYSARTGQPRENNNRVENPELLIWAAGPSDINLVPKSWKPTKILDLSYIESSVARKLAQKLNCQYQSGLSMFIEQAMAQQEFWKNYL